MPFVSEPLVIDFAVGAEDEQLRGLAAAGAVGADRQGRGGLGYRGGLREVVPIGVPAAVNFW